MAPAKAENLSTCKEKEGLVEACSGVASDGCDKIRLLDCINPDGSKWKDPISIAPPREPKVDTPAGGKPTTQVESYTRLKTDVDAGAKEARTKIDDRDKAEKALVKVSEDEAAKADKIRLENEQKVAGKSAERTAERAAMLRMQRAIKEKKPFPREDFQQVQDPEMRKHLELISSSQKLQQSVREDRSRFTAEFSELMKLSSTLAAKEESLDAAPESGPPRVAKRAASASAINISEVPVVSKPSGLSEKKANQALDAISLDLAYEQQTKTSGNRKLTAAEKLKIIQSLALKGPLSEKLKAEAKALEAELAKNASIANHPEGSKNPAAEVALDALDTSSAEEPGSMSGFHRLGFSLAGADTEAEVKRLLNTLEAAGNLKEASDLHAGILESESATLFDRVHVVTRECSRVGCVR